MKSIIVAGILLSAATPAVAGPYANIENNASWQGNDFGAGLTEIHAGYEFDNGVYVQGGPAFVHVEGQETTREYSGKVGYGTDLADDLSMYAEVSFVTEDQEFEIDQLNLGTKVGITYRF